MTYNYVDIGIALILLFTLVEGYIRGFIRSMLGILGYIAAFLVAQTYAATVADYALTHFEQVRQMKANIAERVISTFNSNVSMSTALESGSNAQISQALENGNVMEQLQLPEGIQSQLLSFANNADLANSQSNAVNALAENIASGVIYGLSFIAVVIGVLLVIKIGGLILEGIAKLPVLKQANKLGGVIFGLVKGLLLIFLFMALAAFTAPLTTNLDLIPTIQQSTLGVWFYNNNVLLILLEFFLR